MKGENTMQTKKKRDPIYFQEGMKKYDVEFKRLFHIRLNYFMDMLTNLFGIFSFDVIEFDKYAKRLGYREDKDGSLSNWVEAKYGKEANQLMDKILNL